MTDLTCAALHDMAAELALGMLSGHERAEALAHLATCPDCRERVRELAAVGDGLLGLVPGVEPPVGFEDRVMDRLGFTPRPAQPTQPIEQRPPAPAGPPTRSTGSTGPENRRPRPRRRTWVPIAVAAAVAAVVFGMGGWALGTASQPVTGAASQAAGGGRADDDQLASADLMSGDHQQVGEVFSYEGNPAWVYMVVELNGKTQEVYCQLEQRGGTVVPIGSFTLTKGYGHWGASSPIDPNTVVGARIVGADGTVLATANF
ncbi:MAG TPA: zf-HC2 domain-containing protein [Pseudonocardiaceae bacterium]|jgi:anti-sigma factor RsiW|nr:zf-HC2 domain-containing protein [Pseudonocardiaceae bacterium]